MSKASREVTSFTAVPIILKAAAYPQGAKHNIYIKPHEPRIPDEDTARSLFLVNLPVVTTVTHLKHLFSAQLSAGRVHEVHFGENGARKPSSLTSTKASKKRKRQTVGELEANIESYSLPSTYSSSIYPCGSTAVVVFVDRPSQELSLNAVRKAAKSSASIVWNYGIDTKLPPIGLARYQSHLKLQYPPRSEILRLVDGYMTTYSGLEAARSEENARKRTEPDEDGFITVTRGSKGGVLRQEEAEEVRAKQTAREKGLEDFYRFQMRERRKEQQGQLLKQFEDDKRRVEEMRQRRRIES